jgi:U3 small nucleolar RNA-associated protein 10
LNEFHWIWNIVYVTGLEVLISNDERFRNYKNDLFSHRSKEMDRELMGREQNDKLDVLINSYLKLLSGYFHLPSALKTLEYLIRRHKWAFGLSLDNLYFFGYGEYVLWFLMWFVLSFRIYVHNYEDLILCALPYHDTHAFVRIVQILNIRLERYDCLVVLWCRLLVGVGMVFDVFIGLCEGMVHGVFLRVWKFLVHLHLEWL